VKQSERYLLIIFTISFVLLMTKNVYAEDSLDFGSTNHQIRAIGAFGVALGTQHFYRRGLGANKTASWILSTLTTMGAGMAFDMLAENGTSGGNALAYGIGTFAANTTYALLDSSDPTPVIYMQRNASAEDKLRNIAAVNSTPVTQTNNNNQEVNVNITLPKNYGDKPIVHVEKSSGQVRVVERIIERPVIVEKVVIKEVAVKKEKGEHLRYEHISPLFR